MEVEEGTQFEAQVEKKKCEELIPLYPCDLRNLKNSLKNFVQKKLFKWDQKHQGIVLQCKNVKKASEKASIHDESPVIFVPCSYRLKVLQIKQGDVFLGQVSQTFNTHISLQLFGLFNVLIYADDISDKILKLNDDSEWVDAKENTVVEVSDDIQFEVKTVDLQEFGDFMLIGSLKNTKKNGPYSSIKDKYKVMNHKKIQELVEKSLSKYSNIKE
ncbi:hypothetical protein ABPG74_000029 [Tetrahymena malaccensis]